MFKEKYTDNKLDLSYGFDKTVELESKTTVVAREMGEREKKVILAKTLFKKLAKRLGSYSVSWYFINNSSRIKYFSNNEWHIDEMMTILKGGVK